MSNEAFSGFEIAIIGAAGRFPGAPDIDTFWRNLRDGVESIRRYTAEELIALGRDPQQASSPNFIPAHGALDGFDLFDAQFFGYRGPEADAMDPQHRLFLEAAWEALESAGYNPKRYPGLIGIFAGSSADHYLHTHLYRNPAALARVGDFQANYSNQADFLTTRVSYKLNLTGPSLVVQSACSTSLVAVHLACQQLLSGACDIALAGGVSLTLPSGWGYAYEEGMIFSPDGHCRAFDADAQGCLKGDGLGIVVLKRLADAFADNDTIDAIILGSAINNDGADKIGYTAPGIAGQASVIEAAQALAGVDPDTIGYIEAHGTGTPLGDPIEVAALNQVFRRSTQRRQFCALGAVKTNIGHLDAAAGVAGLIKAVQALKHQTLPPTLHFQRPNPKLNLESSPFFVSATAQPWRGDGFPRRAGVSSFGIGGANAHIILEEAPPLPPTLAARPQQLFLCSARDETALQQASQRLAQHLKEHPQHPLADVAYTLQVGREHYEHRCAVVADNHDAAVAALNNINASDRAPNASPYLVFMFPGQGAQYVEMGRGLYEAESGFRAHVDACAQRLIPHVGCDIRSLLYPNGGDAQLHTEQLMQTAVAQPVLFTLEYALAQWWLSLGVEPAAMIGHSLGEYVAATLAGVFELDDALALVALRGRLMQAQPVGEMLAVPLGVEELTPYLGNGVDLAAINAPGQCVVAGPDNAITALEQQLNTERGLECRRLPTSHAFHSAMMEPVLAPFIEALRAVPRRAPQHPFVSTVTGDWITAEQAQDPHYWARNIRDTVRFAPAVTELFKQPGVLLLEVGPGATLITLARRHSERPSTLQTLASLRRSTEQLDDQSYWLTTLGKLWAAGQEINWEALHGGVKHRRVPLPTYPFQRQRHWVEPLAQQASAPLATRRATELGDYFYVPSWRQSALPGANSLSGRWLIIGDSGPYATALSNAVIKRGGAAMVSLSGPLDEIAGAENHLLDWSDPEQLAALFSELHQQQRLPQHIIHLGDLARTPSSATFYSVLALAQEISALPDTPTLTVVAHRTQSVLGSEPIDPERILPLAVVQVLPVEQPQSRTRFIDIDPTHPAWADQVLAESVAPVPERLVAYRNGQRWLPGVAPVRLPAVTGDMPRLRPRGVYLISGGLGGMGLELAAYLARTVQARLVLLGRTPLSPRESWGEWLAQHDMDDPVSRRLRRLQEIESHGSEVLVLTADIASDEAMIQVRDRVQKHFGAVNGIIHAAGVPPRDELIVDQNRKQIEEVLNAKVHGAKVLGRIFDHQQLDFMALCSSLTTVTALPGRVDYTAANLFLDAYAHACRQPGVVAINWDGWAETGMAYEATGGRVATGLTSAEGVEAWIRLLAQPWPQVLVSSHNLAAPKQGKTPPAKSCVSPDTHKSPPTPQPVDSHYAAPQQAAEKALAEIWQELLGVDRVGVDDNFFALGGDSVVSIQVVSRARRAGLELSIKDIFARQTIAELVRGIAPTETERASTTQPPAAEETRALPAAPALTSDTIPNAPRDQSLPLSFAQERIWFLEQLEPGSVIHNKQAVLTLSGELDVTALRHAFASLVERHEMLRTTYPVIDGEPVQLIGAAYSPEIALLETSQDPEQQKGQLARYTQECISQPFDLANNPPWRARLIRLSPKQHWLVLTLHHITTDAWSMQLLLRELGAYYQAELKGVQADLAPPPLQFADFAAWQRRWLSGPVLKQQLGYWKEQLTGLAPLELPTDRPRPAVQQFAGARCSLQLTAEFTTLVRSLSREQGVTPFMMMLTLFKVLLHRYSGQSDIVVGSPVADRARIETENVLGPFVNNLVLRTNLGGAPSFAELLDRVRNTAMAANEYRELPFERLVEALHPERDRSRSPLFQVMFVYLNVPTTSHHWDGLQVEAVESHSDTSEFDLSLYISDPGAGQPLSGWFEYSTALFDTATIARMADHLLTLATAAACDPQQRIGELPLLTSAEQQALQTWNSTQREFPRDLGIHHLFEAQARLRPEAIAVEFAGMKLTYAELERRANQLARRLRACGVGAESYVGIALERNGDLLIALLGVLKAGGAYLPLDPSYPADRIAYMVDDSGAHVVLTHSALALQLPPSVTRLCFDSEAASLAQLDATPLEGAFTPNQLAYVIYTSGSTGKPKGVQIEHGAVVNFLTTMSRRPGLTASDALLAVTTVSFDIHVLELFLPLSVGARIILADRETATDPRRLLTLLEVSKATTMQATPATWRMLVDAGWRRRQPLKALCGGEALTADLATGILARCGELWNLYGPTEATVWATVEQIEAPTNHISIGQPIDNLRAYVVDGNGQPLPVGARGELWLGGAGVARGYLGRPDLTAQQFVADPVIAGERVYRTGDLARRLANGRLEVLGRLDHQVKLRGHRLELGEVETVLISHPAVHQAVAVVREDRPGDQRLTVYLLGTDTHHPDAATLRSFTATHLPDYMVPTAFIWLERYPLTPNNKLDRRALPAPEPEMRPARTGEPLTAAEQLVADMFAQVLGIDGVGRYDNFFDLGGHSLLSMKVVDHFEKATGLRMQPGELFQQTVGQIAAHYEKSLPRSSATETAVSAPVTPLFFGAADRSLYGCHHTPVTPAHRVAVLISPPGGHEYERSHRALRQLAAQLAKEGFHALRFDYCGTGDSMGDYEEATLTQWRKDIAIAIDECKQRSGVEQVVVIGLRLGATLALQACHTRTDIAGIVLWSPVWDGETMLTEWRELQRAHDTALGSASSGNEILGLPLTPTMSSELSSMALPQTVHPPLLIRQRADETIPATLIARWRNDGVHLNEQTTEGAAIWRQEPLEGVVPIHDLRAIVAWTGELA